MIDPRIVDNDTNHIGFTAVRPMSNRLPTGPGSRGGRWLIDPEYRRAYHRAWRAAHPDYREREALRRRRARGDDPAGVVDVPRYPRPLPVAAVACACDCGCRAEVVTECGFCRTGMHEAAS